MIKLVAIDLDGTLLTDKKEVSLRNQEALAKAKAQGVKIVLCTGRPLMAIRPYLDLLNLREAGDYSITFNGGLVQQNDTGAIVEKVALTREDVTELITLATQLNMPLDILSDEIVLCLPTSTEYQTIYPSLNPLLVYKEATVAQLDEYTLFNKAVTAYHQDILDQWITQIPAAIREKFEVIKTRNNLLEFMPKGVTKAAGIARLAEDLGITQAEVMAIGDEENDFSMVEYAAMGVAMENAVPVVKEVADFITKTNEEDGVAIAIERFVLE